MLSSSKRGLHGPRPQPLQLPRDSSSSSPPPSKKPRASAAAPEGGRAAAPVIVYEHAPRVVHARPQEFMAVVQQLTGRPPAPLAAAPGASEGDPLVLTLGQCAASPTASLAPPPMAAGLPSPGFLFSPTTLQLFLELSPLF